MYSIPLLGPYDDLSVWHRPAQERIPISNSFEATEHATTNHNTQRNTVRGTSYLAQLAADERALEQRKQNVQRFGAGWLRPPGLAKTYQATMDEAAEREEQEELARRELRMRELADAQEVEAQRQQDMERGDEMDHTVNTENPERDLDDEIPEAEEATFNEDDSLARDASQLDGEELDMDADLDAEVDVERMLDLEEAEMTGMLDERDLDDDVPEAGSYQHTDTEVEDSSSEDEQMADPSSERQAEPAARQSMASADDGWNSSSFLSSSPVPRRRDLASGNAFRERLLQGRQQ